MEDTKHALNCNKNKDGSTMSYNSPIEIVKKMQEQYEEDVVNNVLKCVHSYGINVDKDELIKALKYDRDQYDIGYADGIKNQYNVVKEFVRWYKERLMHIQEHEKELLEDDVKHEYSYLVEYRKGTTDMLDRLLLHMDDNLERFLEEEKA